MKQPIIAETLSEYFVEQIEVLVDAVVTQVTYTPEQIFSFSFTLVGKSGYIMMAPNNGVVNRP